MFRRHWLTLFKVAVLIAMLVSSMLFIHYLAPADSDFCGASSGCEAVRRSGFSYFHSTYANIPAFGMIAYGVLFALAVGKPNARRLNWLRILAGIGGVCAILFILSQALLIGAFCWMCMIVDAAAVLAAFAAVAAYAAQGEEATVLNAGSWAGFGIAALGLPLLWFWVRPTPPVPEAIREFYQDGKINVVEFADFQCPFCRSIHPVLKLLTTEYGDRVHFKRLHMPLGIHVLAEGAARASVCATRQGQEAAMADLLFEGELGDEAYESDAKQLGLDLPTFKACLSDPATQAAIDADVELFRKAALRGLPTTFVGDEHIVGARPVATFREAFERAASPKHGFRLSGGIFLGLCAVMVVGLLILGRLAPSGEAS